MNDEREGAFQLIALLVKIEKLCGKHKLVSPIGVDAADVDGRVWRFDFDPSFESVELLLSRPRLPITLHLRDAVGKIIEQQITNLSLESELGEPVLQ